MFDAAFWDERYRTHPTHIWSGRPNRYLVSEAADLPPSTALDAGCGEGADAIWLAERGWRVTGLDVSTVALERAAAHALEAGVAERIDWREADLMSWQPSGQQYGLISAQYLHLPSARRATLFAALAGCVAPGGALLIVGHHPSDMDTAIRRPKIPDLFFVGDQLAALLDPGEWAVVTDAVPGRSVEGPDGEHVAIRDTVFRAQRRQPG